MTKTTDDEVLRVGLQAIRDGLQLAMGEFHPALHPKTKERIKVCPHLFADGEPRRGPIFMHVLTPEVASVFVNPGLPWSGKIFMCEKCNQHLQEFLTKVGLPLPIVVRNDPV